MDAASHEWIRTSHCSSPRTSGCASPDEADPDVWRPEERGRAGERGHRGKRVAQNDGVGERAAHRLRRKWRRVTAQRTTGQRGA
eukprot:6198625-Pleurochrysis_carterae.AAC.3